MHEPAPRVSAATPPDGAGRAGPTAFQDIGRGPAVVFIHGVGLRKEVWTAQRDAFAGVRRVIAYDMLGHGGSGLGPRDAGLEGFVDQLVRLLDDRGVAVADIVGHSMGALVALGFALAHPHRVRRLVALNAVYDRPDDQRAAVLERAGEIERIGPRSAAGRAIGRWFGDDPPPAQAAQAATVRAWLENADPVGYARAYRLFATGDRAHLGRLSTLPMPVLYLTGDLDRNSSPAMSRRMAAETPDGWALSLPGERHMMALASPDAVTPVIRAFLGGGDA